MCRDFTYGERYNINKHYLIDEGFESVRPDLCLASNDPVISLHVSQLKYHREQLEKILDDSDNWKEDDDYEKQ